MRTFGLVVLVASSLLVGCSGEAASDADDQQDETLGDSEEALSSREHFAPAEVELDWKPGCGMRLPDGAACYMGLSLTYSKLYSDLKVSVRTTINNTKNTLTVKLDTYSTGGPHALAPVAPETKQLGHPSRLSMMKTYQAKVVDWQNNVLWSGDIRPMPAP